MTLQLFKARSNELFGMAMLVFTSSTNAQIGFAMPDPTVMLPAGVLGIRNDCRSRFPELAPELDRALETMIQRNVESFSREQWLQLNSMRIPPARPLTREECAQIAPALETWDWKPLIVGARKEAACMQSLRVATERSGKSKPVIGIRLDDSATEARVAEVESNGPAGRSGIEAGDVISEYGGKDTPSKCQLALAVLDSIPGKPSSVVVMRAGKQMRVQVTAEAGADE